MKRLLPFCFLIVLLTCNAVFAKAQDFPATKKQAVEWLSASEWKLKALVVDGRRLNAELINMKASISFIADSSYSMEFMSEKRQGIYEVNMNEKWVRLFNNETSKEILIRNLKAEEFEAKSLGEDDGELIMIFVPLK